MNGKLGKITHDLFETFINNRCGHRRKEVIAGAQLGVDVSVIDLSNGMALALTSDPLSLIPSLGLEESAWLSVHLMANDIATTGHPPMYGQFVLNLPATFSKSDFRIYWEYIHKFSKEIKMTITGGHTGFIEGQNSTIAGGGTLLTMAPKDTILLSRYAKSGDLILVTKTCALSATAILAMSFPETVKNKAGTAVYQDACNAFYHTSSLQDALLAVDNREDATVTAMHDVTEGGVLGAIHELAVASGNGALIYHDRLPVAEAQQAVCDIFDLDPRYCIGAGSMIITCSKESSMAIISRLARKAIPCTIVGELCDQQQGISIIENGTKTDLNFTGEDPYWAAFFGALKRGWK